MRESVDDIDDNVHARSWANDELLHLDGVLKLSFRELKAQLQVTAGILDCISEEVARRARCDSVHADPRFTDVCAKNPKKTPTIEICNITLLFARVSNISWKNQRLLIS